VADPIWVREWDHGEEFLENLGDKSWADCPKPRIGHLCWTQTRGRVKVPNLRAVFVERCPCGAIRMDGGPWDERNCRE